MSCGGGSVDAGMPPQTYLIFEGMRTHGFDPHDIKLALLSHAHFDHCGGMKAVIEYTGAKLYAAAEDTEELIHPTELLKNDYQIVVPDAAYRPSERITLGSICMEPVVVGKGILRRHPWRSGTEQAGRRIFQPG